MILEEGRVAASTKLGELGTLLAVRAPEIAERANAGQFVQQTGPQAEAPPGMPQPMPPGAAPGPGRRYLVNVLDKGTQAFAAAAM